MTSQMNDESQRALESAQNLQRQYTTTGLNSANTEKNSINQGLAGGESPLIASAFAAQRAGISDSAADQSRAARQTQAEGSKKALSGGNAFSLFSPSDIGAKLANALYGSKFAEGQADLGQKMNLMNMAMGGAGTAGNAGMQAGQSQLGAIGFLPNYNTTYANVLGAAAGAGSVYGAYQNWAAAQQPPPQIPMGWSSTSVVQPPVTSGLGFD